MYIYAHNRYSEGASLLRKDLRLKSLYRSLERGRRLFLVPIINWGSGSYPENLPNLGRNMRWLNKPEQVAIATNKLFTFECLKQAGVSIPEFTTERGEAQQWVSDGHIVVVRTLLNASEGRGIILWNRELPLAENVRAPLYVKYIKKKHEYRIHVVRYTSERGGVEPICIQQKLRKRGFEDRDNQIRNHDNGWVFAVNDIIAPHEKVIIQARNALEALGLEFGAVDVIWNERQQRAYVLEVNTAPGLEPGGTALKAYVEYFRNFL